MKKFAYLTSLLVFFAFTSFSQQWTIGTGTGSNAYDDYPSPFGAWYSGARSQFIYRASELTAAGMTPGPIHNLAFNVVALNATGPHIGYEIKIKGTTNNALTVWETGMTSIYTTGSYTPVMGWNTFTLSTPFVWNGTDNIVIETCHWNGVLNFFENPSVQWTTGLPANSIRVYRDDFASACPSTSTNTYTTTTRSNIRFTRLPSCTGTPNAGTATGPANACPQQPFNLTLTGYTTGLGITIQWQSSPPGQNNWTDIAGATPATYSATQSVATDYRAKVTCANATPPNNEAFSNALAIGMNSYLNCYCTPTYVNGCIFDWISNVTFAGINNNTTCSGSGYTQYSTPVPDILTGYSYPLSVTTDGDDEGLAVWIDYNRNGVFEQSEAVIYNQYIGTVPATYTANVTVPANASPGLTRMRVRCQWAAGVTDPCVQYDWGETEDYFVNIKYAPLPPAVTVNNTSNNPFVACSGENIILTATSTISNAQYIWSGPNYTATGPVIALNNIQTGSAGVYTVRLIDGQDTSGPVSRSIVVHQTPADPVVFSDTVCLGNAAKAFVLKNSTGNPYLWYDSPTGGSVQYTGDTLNVPSLTQNMIYYVATKSTTSTCESKRMQVNVVVGPEPVVNLGADTTFCEGTPLVLDAGNPGGTYKWSTGEISQTIKVINVSGEYFVTVDKYCEASDTINVEIDPLPYISGISYVRTDKTYFYEPANEKFVDSYLWLFGDGTSDTARTPTHVYPTGGPYTVSLVVFNRCGSDTTELIIPTGISSVKNSSEEIVLYPNPAANTITVKTNLQTKLKKMVIYNSVGVKVLEEQPGKYGEHTIDISSLPSGQYLISILSENGKINRNFSIIH